MLGRNEPPAPILAAAQKRCSCTVYVTHKLRIAKLYESIVCATEHPNPILHFGNENVPRLLSTETVEFDGDSAVEERQAVVYLRANGNATFNFECSTGSDFAVIQDQPHIVDYLVQYVQQFG